MIFFFPPLFPPDVFYIRSLQKQLTKSYFAVVYSYNDFLYLVHIHSMQNLLAKSAEFFCGENSLLDFF